MEACVWHAWAVEENVRLNPSLSKAAYVLWWPGRPGDRAREGGEREREKKRAREREQLPLHPIPYHYFKTDLSHYDLLKTYTKTASLST